MNKLWSIVKKTLKAFFWVIISLGIILVLVAFLLRIPSIQSMVSNYAASFISNKTNTRVEIEKVNIAFLKSFLIEGIYLEDFKNDTLLYAGHAEVNISLKDIFNKHLHVTSLILTDVVANPSRNGTDSLFNYSYLLDAFGDSAKKVKPRTEKKSEWTFTVDNLSLKKISINYLDDYGGIHAFAALNLLELKMNQMDLAKFVFDINSLFLDGLNAKVLIYKLPVKNENETESILPAISAESIIIKKTVILYSDSLIKKTLDTDLGEFRMNDFLADMHNRTIKSDSVYLSDSRLSFNTVSPDSSLHDIEIDTLTRKSWTIAINSFDLKNNSIALNSDDKKEVENAFDANHLEFSKISFSIKDIYFSDDSTKASVNNFTAAGQNDFLIKKFETKFRMDPNSVSAENLKLQTNNSSIDADVKVKYASVESLRDSLQSVFFDLKMRTLSVRNSEIAYFKPDLTRIDFFKNKDLITAVSGTLTGTLNNLSGKNLIIETGKSTSLKSDFNIRGLPAVDNAFFNFRDLEIYTGNEDLLLLAGSAIPASIELPHEINLEGSFLGNLRSFETMLKLNSSLGSAHITAETDRDENFFAKIYITDFDIGKLLKDTSFFGPVTMVATTKGKGLDLEKVSAGMQAHIPSFRLNGYTYRNLEIYGTTSGRQFDGTINLDDENAVFNLSAHVNMNPGHEEYEINSNLTGADLQKLNFSKDDIRIGFKMNSSLRGGSMNGLNGKAGISDITVIRDDEIFNLDSINLTMFNEPGKSDLNVSSDLIDIRYSGTIFPGEIGEIPVRFIDQYFAFSDSVSKRESDLSGQGAVNESHSFNFDIQIHDHPFLRGALLPQLTEFIPGPITGTFDYEKNELRFNAAMERIVLKTNEFSDLSIDISSDVNALNYKVSGRTISNGQIKLDNFLFSGDIADNQINANLSLNNENNEPQLLLNSLITKEYDDYKVRFDPENFWLMNNKWTFSDDNYILLGENGFLIHDLSMRKTGSEISIASVHDHFNDDLNIKLINFNLEDIAGIIESDSAFVKGVTDGNILLKRSGDSYGLIADATINNLYVKEVSVGRLNVLAENPSPDRFNIDVNLSGEKNDVTVKGYFLTKGEENPVKADIVIGSLSMETIQAFSMGAIKDASGIITGALNIAGNTSIPEISGNLNFNNVFITPAALNNRLNLLQETIMLKEDGIYFESFDILDAGKNKASINGAVKMNNFRDLAFALQISAKEFMLFNTSRKDNENLFGRLIIDSDVGITGPFTLPVISAKLKMKKDSYFTFAVPEKKLTAERGEDIVQFEDSDLNAPILSRKKETRETGLTGYDISSVIEIDEQATLRVLLDPATSDSLVVRGDAALSFAIDPSGKMTLTGVYNVNEGSYLVSLESIIKKEFDIKKGSTITWNGDPMDADVSIDAAYSVRAAPIDLVADQMAGMSETDQNMYKQRFPFEVILKLRGEILNPEISFDIQLAPEDKGIFGGSVNAKLIMLNEDPSALNKQVFALLILGRFVQENPFQTDAASSAVRSTVGKFLSDQLNQWSSKLVPGVELNFDLQSYNDYQTGQAEGRTQLDVGVKKQLFNERLSVEVEGVVDVEGERAKQNNASDITSDLTIEYKLTEDGRFRLRGFRHNTYEGAIEGQIVETGAGFKYVRDFNRWKYFFHKRKADSSKNTP